MLHAFVRVYHLYLSLSTDVLITLCHTFGCTKLYSTDLFYSAPMILCIQEEMMRFNRKYKQLQNHAPLARKRIKARGGVAERGMGCILHFHSRSIINT